MWGIHAPFFRPALAEVWWEDNGLPECRDWITSFVCDDIAWCTFPCASHEAPFTLSGIARSDKLLLLLLTGGIVAGVDLIVFNSHRGRNLLNPGAPAMLWVIPYLATERTLFCHLCHRQPLQEVRWWLAPGGVCFRKHLSEPTTNKVLTGLEVGRNWNPPLLKNSVNVFTPPNQSTVEKCCCYCLLKLVK